AAFGAAALTGTPGRLEGYGPVSGRYLELLLSSPAHGVFTAVVTDITQRRREREWMRVTLGSIADAVLATDRSGKVALINKAACELAGWQADEAIGHAADAVFRVVDERTEGFPQPPVA